MSTSEVCAGPIIIVFSAAGARRRSHQLTSVRATSVAARRIPTPAMPGAWSARRAPSLCLQQSAVMGNPKLAFCGCLLFSVVLIGVGFGVGGLKTPNGDLSLFYQVETCPNASASFSVPAGATWVVSALRDPTATGTACGLSPSTAPAAITLDKSDGFRGGASYSPVFLIQNEAYALLSFSITDATGAVILPQNIVALGVDNYFPWSAHGATPVPGSAVATATNPPSAPGGRRLLSTSDDDDTAAIAAPTARRLLKGGFTSSTRTTTSTSSRSSFFGSSSSRSSSYSRGASGSSRWGAASSPTRRTTGYSSSSRSYSSYSRGSTTYGGHSYYAVGGRGYYMGYHPYPLVCAHMQYSTLTLHTSPSPHTPLLHSPASLLTTGTV